MQKYYWARKPKKKTQFGHCHINLWKLFFSHHVFLILIQTDENTSSHAETGVSKVALITCQPFNAMQPSHYCSVIFTHS